MQTKYQLLSAHSIFLMVVLSSFLVAAFGVGSVSATASARQTKLLTDVNLDNDATRWNAFTEIPTPGIPTPSFAITNVASPSLDGRSLRCAITGGHAYSNLHCYRNLNADPNSNTFMMSLAFYYQPRSTFNNQGGSSIVQALEFTMSKWVGALRYEWAVQWDNVDAGGPKWRYWDPKASPSKWVDLKSITGPRGVLELEGQQWYSLRLEGDVIAGQAHYRRFSIDKLNDGIEEQVYPLDINVQPASETGDKLAVAVQLDGNNFNNTGFLSPYEIFLDKVTLSHVDGTSIDQFFGGKLRGTMLLAAGESARQSYTGLNSGPVKITSTREKPILAAERTIYKVNSVNTSFSEMMALPNSQLDTIYWLPWYNNVDLDTQLRIANTGGSTSTIHVYVAGQEMQGSPFTLAAGASTRKSFAGINNGPVKITSNQKIVAAERVIYKVNGNHTSFSEMMALPNAHLSKTYWLPWYNNLDLDTQLRIANGSSNPATVHVYIAGQEMQGSPFTLAAGTSTRKSFVVNNGPVKIVSNENLIVAERLIYGINNVNTSFSEMMALPDERLDTSYWLPWYNNVDLDTQLRIANVSSGIATVHILIGGAEMTGSPFDLAAGASTRKSFTGINRGPVQIFSNHGVPIIAAERVIYKVDGVNTSFSEMMGLPNSQLDTTYWLPWYNNVDLDTQLRFGVP